MSETPVLRQFSQLLQSLEDGEFHQELTDLMHEINTTLTEHITNHGGKPEAELSLKLKFKAERGVVTVKPEMKHKMPDAPRSTATLWQTSAGFTAVNPKQMEMFNGQPKVVADKSDVKSI